ncbi:MAG: hypothetical protein ACPGJE_05970, partial [Wenzhouxiangellaceae bacterium]
AWQQHFDAGGVVLATEVDGMPVIDGLTELADQVRDGTPAAEVSLDGVFDQYVRPIQRAALAGQ